MYRKGERYFIHRFTTQMTWASASKEAQSQGWTTNPVILPVARILSPVVQLGVEGGSLNIFHLEETQIRLLHVPASTWSSLVCHPHQPAHTLVIIIAWSFLSPAPRPMHYKIDQYLL